MTLGKGNLASRHKRVLALLFIGPCAIALGKWAVLPTSGFLVPAFSLAGLSADMQHRISYIMLVPFGAVLVVFFRLFLGIRLLGPFRSVLIAVAFQITGIVPGLLFLAAVTGTVVALRGPIKALRLPYFARVSVMLSAVALIMLMALLASTWLGVAALERAAYLPLVVLCLMAEGFARTLAKEGLASALWRGTMTALVAVLIASLFQINGLRELFLRFPELLAAETGCIVVIAEFFDLRLLAGLNPAPGVKPRRKAGKQTKSRTQKALPSGGVEG